MPSPHQNPRHQRVNICKTICIGGALLSPALHPLASAQGVEWSEKDLARSVHRAEQTFEGGEMSRAYGLFAHLVSVAGDRAFLHYRFGATCTYTTQRLSEAYEHLLVARELGILETEHKAGWHYHMARYHQAKFQFDEALINLRSAIDLGSEKDDWMADAKLRFGQCSNNENFDRSVEALVDVDKLVSHSGDFFRLYEIPVAEGRLLNVPEQLRTKEDKRRKYSSQLHWLPGHRYAFYASYGKDGDTGLDIYRVAVNGVGEYGNPEKLPEPVNTNFDDSNPICIPHQGEGSTDQLFFSSSRPQSLGGLDVFEVSGSLTAPTMVLSQIDEAKHLPFEINSTADDYLYWESQDTGEAWLTTNRNQDFEGREVWRFAVDRQQVHPMVVSLKADDSLTQGRLKINKFGSDKGGLDSKFGANESLELLIAAGTEIEVSWEANDGSTSYTEYIQLPTASSGSFAADPVLLSVGEGASTLQSQLNETIWVEESQIDWGFDAMANRVHANLFGEALNENVFAALKAHNLHQVGIEKVLNASNEKGNRTDEIPDWMLEAMSEIGIITNPNDAPKTVTHIRGLAVHLQRQMEKAQCWDAPGSEDWKVQAVIDRYGETALAMLSEEVRQLRMEAQRVQDQWGTWSDAVAEYTYQMGVASEDWDVMRAFCEAQFQAFAGAYVHADDMFRRIDSHLRFERWVADALPMNIPQFRADLSSLLTSHPDLLADFEDAAKASHQNTEPASAFESLQTSLWSKLTDEIIAYQDLGVYTLPGMESAQNWFLRSGGIVEELHSMPVPRERLAKGQQAVGLAWETYREGAERHDQVVREAEMSAGSWWQFFGPNDQEISSEAYGGYELFEKHGDQILDQAHAYQKELDIIRTAAKDGEAYTASMKKAIAMRSSIKSEMMALFGGERSMREEPLDSKSPIESIDTQTAGHPMAQAKVDIGTELNAAETTVEESASNAEFNDNLEKSPESGQPVPEPATPSEATTTVLRYTVQVGAFANKPNFEEMPSSEELFILSQNGRLTKYGSGKFNSHAEAKAHLRTIQTWATDAFIKPIQTVVESSANPEPGATLTAPATSVVTPPRTAPTQPSTDKTKQFRVRIVSYTETLEPSEVATLLRLGNEMPLRTARMANQTVYFTRNFDSLNSAKAALETCLNRGFSDAEIEVLYE